eukprot:CAMPEP_0185455570 /NCGR_PEP_ID=MMETSP1365-20130426/75530_1 /TAXON_ID=38817 /ORGANISM="Gephyrocapsa oceanica, Strain RCC1303" /LENGTH=64 /DNA_ID=CAMNT_0028061969 /DNA_START=77 /DNA_END=268 /DNA_ORIENTATION=+
MSACSCGSKASCGSTSADPGGVTKRGSGGSTMVPSAWMPRSRSSPNGSGMAAFSVPIEATGVGL